jgi:transcriptional regulator with XRE-family HTH domain/tetratricopeptide (TPR) repeat protein
MNEESTSTFGALLRRYRIAAGFTQEMLAARSGVSPHGISDLEREARKAPRQDTVRLLIGALNLSSEECERFEGAARRARAAARRPSHVSLQAPSALLAGSMEQFATMESLFITGEPMLLGSVIPGIVNTASHEGLYVFVAKSAAALYGTLAQLYALTGQNVEQLQAAEQAAGFARLAADQLLLTQVTVCRGTALLTLGRMDEAIQVLVSCLPALRSSGNLRCLATTLHSIALIHQARGQFGEQGAYLNQALDAAVQCGEPTLLVFLRCAHGAHALLIGEWDRAHCLFEEAADLLVTAGPSWAAPYPLLGRGGLLLAQGKEREATHALEESIDVARQVCDSAAVCTAQLTLAEAEILRGDSARALARLQGEHNGGLEQNLVALVLQAWALLETGDMAGANMLLDQAETRSRTQGHRLGLIESLRIRAHARLTAGLVSDALMGLDEASKLAQAMPYPYAEVRLGHAYARINVRTQAIEQARRGVQRALTICKRLGERLYAEAILAILASQLCLGICLSLTELIPDIA